MGYMSYISGVELKPIAMHSDNRGSFQEVLKETDLIYGGKFGQLNHSVMYDNVIKAWHIHQIQTDYWYVPIGVILAVLHDKRAQSKSCGVTEEYVLGNYNEPTILKIPPGVAHGLKVLQSPAHLLYVTSHFYNPSDEGRIPFDDPEIGYDWLKRSEIK